MKILMFAILILAVLADLLVPVILGFKYPGYHHFYDTISTLGTRESPVKKQESLTLMMVGILFIMFAFGEHFAFQNVKGLHHLYLVGIVAFGVGCILAGIFPEDPKGAVESVSGKIHGIASGIGFMLLILNPLWAVFMAEFAKFKAVNLILFIAGLITFILFIGSENRDTGLLRFTGLFQRLNLIVLYGCLVLNYTAILSIES